jgi:hypothetical protein
MNIKSFQKVPHLVGEDDEDTLLLSNMADEALAFIKQFAWCPPIKDMYLACGVGGIVGIFLVEFTYKIQSTDEKLWIFVGDIPSAYLVVELNDNPTQALERYCQLMDDWILAVKTSADLKEVYPVDAAPTIENAEQLKERIDLLRREMIFN